MEHRNHPPNFLYRVCFILPALCDNEKYDSRRQGKNRNTDKQRLNILPFNQDVFSLCLYLVCNSACWLADIRTIAQNRPVALCIGQIYRIRVLYRIDPAALCEACKGISARFSAGYVRFATPAKIGYRTWLIGISRFRFQISEVLFMERSISLLKRDQLAIDKKLFRIISMENDRK